MEKPLINWEINLILTWSANCVIYDAVNQATTSAIADTKLYIQVGTLSVQDNAKLLQQLKPGFKRTINPSFQGLNRLFVSSFEDYAVEQDTQDIFFQSRNKKLQCYDSWTKFFWSTNKTIW